MKENSRKMIDECIDRFPSDSQSTYKELSEYAVSLGYMPKWIKVRVDGKSVNGDSLTFINSKVKRTLMKIKPRGNPLDKDMPCLALKFYATPIYSDIFKQGIKQVIENFDARYTGCYGCGNCKGDLQGYTYTYPDGKKVFRCGGELIEIPPITADNILGIKELMKNQDQKFLELVNAK